MVQELRPRGIGEMLDAAVALYRSRLRRLLTVTAAVVVPVQILSTIVLLSAQPDGFSPNFTGGLSPRYDSGSAAAQLAAYLVILLVGLISTAFVTAVCTRIVADAYIERPAGDADAVRLAAGRIFAVAGVSLLVAMAQVAGLLFCLVGVIVPITLFAVAVPALVLEGVGVFRALGRSIELTKTHFLRVLGLVLTAQLLGIVVNLGLAAAVAALLRTGGGTTALVISQGIASTVAAVLTTPFIAAAIVSCYFDLRIRNEAFDVQLLMQHNDARHAAAHAAVPPAAAR